MGVITISRGSYSKGKEIAEKLAERLGYECVSRDILLEASEHFSIPEIKLVRAIHDAPTILDRFQHGKERYIAFIREAFLEHIQNDNIIYHGLAGHFFSKGILNILKVRIIANIEDRIIEEMKREDISEKEARHLLIKDDRERHKWSRHLYGIDTKDPRLYDIVLHIENLTADDTVDILSDIAKRPHFQTTPESQMVIKDSLLAAKVQTALLDKFPHAQVKSKNEVIWVTIEAPLLRESTIVGQVKDLLKDIEGIKEIKTYVTPLDTFM